MRLGLDLVFVETCIGVTTCEKIVDIWRWRAELPPVAGSTHVRGRDSGDVFVAGVSGRRAVRLRLSKRREHRQVEGSICQLPTQGILFESYNTKFIMILSHYASMPSISFRRFVLLSLLRDMHASILCPFRFHQACCVPRA